MRLDRMLSECGIASRKETAKAVRAGEVSVNSVIAKKADLQVNPETDIVLFRGSEVVYRKFVYLLLNKPDGYVSATEDGKDPVVTELVAGEYRKMGVFPCGRLDKHTLGLMLLTNDGALSHRLLSPKSHVTKEYRFTVKFRLSGEDVAALEAGVDIGGYITKSCKIVLEDEKNGVISITEGKYHQIKLMMEAVHNQITALERISFGPIRLPEDLERGAYRLLTEDEIKTLQNSGKEMP